MSITLPGFIFKEFLEVDKVEAPNLLKDDGFRKSIVTATGVRYLASYIVARN